MPFASIAQTSSSDDRRAIRAAVRAAVADETVTRLLVEPRVAERVAPSLADETDTYLAQVLAALMVLERLDVEVALLAGEPSTGTKRWGLPHGPAARDLAEHGTARAVPLIRDDTATVLVGRARHFGADGATLHGETYVDSDLLFTGEAKGVRIEPTLTGPGVRARAQTGFFPGRWRAGRAVQTGGTNLVVEREGVLSTRVVERSTYYRHDTDLHIVLP